MNAKYGLHEKHLIFNPGWGCVEVEIIKLEPPGTVFGASTEWSYHVQNRSTMQTDWFYEGAFGHAKNAYRPSNNQTLSKYQLSQKLWITDPFGGDFQVIVDKIDINHNHNRAGVLIEYTLLVSPQNYTVVISEKDLMEAEQKYISKGRGAPQSLSVPFHPATGPYGNGSGKFIGDPYHGIGVDLGQMQKDHVQHLVKGLPAQACSHSYKLYEGFNESYHYCTKCDHKHGSKQ